MSAPISPLPPTHTDRFAPSELQLPLAATVVFSTDSTEERGALPSLLRHRNSHPEKCVVIQGHSEEDILVEFGGDTSSIDLRDDDSLGNLFRTDAAYLDVSGMPHHVWAPLLRAMRSRVGQPHIIYVEPQEYRPHPSPTAPKMFDLSIEFKGLSPLPGFARLGAHSDDRTLLIALLGFEGSRPQQLLTELDASPKVVPIVGVPGFQLEYPAFTIACNRDFLADTDAFSDIWFARASCPFDAYEVIKKIHKGHSRHHVYLAPVGTKPHALGALLYAMDHPDSTEVLYDHPIRKPGRTRGRGTVHVYSLATFDGA